MKSKSYFIGILLGILSANLTIFCSPTRKNSIDENHTKKLQLESLQNGKTLWNQHKKTETTYFYWQINISGEIGRYNITGVQIINEIPVLRFYKSFTRKDQGFKFTKTWIETKKQIGKSKDGFLALRIDQIYDLCAKKSLQRNKSKYTITYETDKKGALLTCEIVPKNCKDDCNSGFVLGGIVYREISQQEQKDFLNKPFTELK